MRKFAIDKVSCLNWIMRNTVENVRQKLISKYQEKPSKLNQIKSTDINVLLNRVKTNQKNESRRKIYFSAAASTGLILFGLLIF